MRSRKPVAFTLIELLVVIAVIAVLMGILMPALRRARQQAAAITCMANARTLSLAWYQYVDDNDGMIVSSVMNRGTRTAGWIGAPRSQTGQEYNETQANPPVLDEDEIRGIKQGRLYAYVGDAGAYHCPADTIRISLYDQTRVFTTYALPACLNGWMNGQYPQIKRFQRIPRPAQKYNLVESAELRNFNMNGRFVMGAPEYTNLRTWQWWGPMAVNHGDASVLGFCDGHAEKRKWSDRFTIERVDKLFTQKVQSYGREAPPAGQTEDLAYMARGWAYEVDR